MQRRPGNNSQSVSFGGWKKLQFRKPAEQAVPVIPIPTELATEAEKKPFEVPEAELRKVLKGDI